MIPSPSGIKKGSKQVLNWASLIQTVDRFTLLSGRLLAWCALAMALLTAAVVILRYGFSTGSIAMQEAVTYLHGSLFMLGVAYALTSGGHVRVDIFYREFSARQRAWVDALGGIVFLLPLCAVIMILSWGYVGDAWEIRESSPEPGGIPYLYILKTLLPLMAINLAIAGMADILRNAHTLIRHESL
ncbi:MAG: TRAP-type mannitol/chloroaromatic compound transport system permease small subunit [Glaciecola sp.]|jgi:TRAP-type mannitol/chloroaromatic compound transport system permease small subunit